MSRYFYFPLAIGVAFSFPVFGGHSMADINTSCSALLLVAEGAATRTVEAAELQELRSKWWSHNPDKDAKIIYEDPQDASAFYVIEKRGLSDVRNFLSLWSEKHCVMSALEKKLSAGEIGLEACKEGIKRNPVVNSAFFIGQLATVGTLGATLLGLIEWKLGLVGLTASSIGTYMIAVRLTYLGLPIVEKRLLRGAGVVPFVANPAQDLLIESMGTAKNEEVATMLVGTSVFATAAIDWTDEEIPVPRLRLYYRYRAKR